jgi:uncharacterized membrane protein YgdD (TMEM256/DUF423 family)
VSSGRTLAAAALLIALATLSGAFGAHALKAHLPAERLQLWDTAVRYHFFHALGLLGVGLTLRTQDGSALRTTAVLIIVGIVLFSGSLYALALGAPRPTGALTPIGGAAWIAAWLLFAWAVLRPV